MSSSRAKGLTVQLKLKVKLNVCWGPNRQSDTGPQDKHNRRTCSCLPPQVYQQRSHHTVLTHPRYIHTSAPQDTSHQQTQRTHSLNVATAGHHTSTRFLIQQHRKTHPIPNHSTTGTSHLHRHPLQLAQQERLCQLTYIWTSNIHPPRTPGHPKSESMLSIHRRCTSPMYCIVVQLTHIDFVVIMVFF